MIYYCIWFCNCFHRHRDRLSSINLKAQVKSLNRLCVFFRATLSRLLIWLGRRHLRLIVAFFFLEHLSNHIPLSSCNWARAQKEKPIAFLCKLIHLWPGLSDTSILDVSTERSRGQHGPLKKIAHPFVFHKCNCFRYHFNHQMTI